MLCIFRICRQVSGSIFSTIFAITLVFIVESTSISLWL